MSPASTRKTPEFVARSTCCNGAGPPGGRAPLRLRARSIGCRLPRRPDLHPWISGRPARAVRACRAVPAEEGLDPLNDPIEERHVDQERHGNDHQDDEPDKPDRRPHEAIEMIQTSAWPRRRNRGPAHDEVELIIDLV